MCGDATIRKDVDTLMNGETVDMVFTDPPYGVGFDKHHLHDDKWVRQHSKRPLTGFKNWGKIQGDKSLETYYLALQILAAIAKTKSWYLCTSSRFIGKILNKLDELGIYHATPIVWVKEHWVMSWERYHAQHEHLVFCGDGALPTGKKSIWYGAHNESTVWQIPRDNMTTSNLHPTQKPIPLIVRAIKNSSQNPDIILDVFGGSGSTLIACEQTGRRCRMMEIDPRYCQVIVDRWQAYTGEKVVMVKTGEINVH